MALAGVHDALQLQAAEGAVLDLVLQAGLVRHIWRLHSRQTGSLDHRVWMLLPIRQLGGLVVGECEAFLIPDLPPTTSSLPQKSKDWHNAEFKRRSMHPMGSWQM